MRLRGAFAVVAAGALLAGCAGLLGAEDWETSADAPSDGGGGASSGAVGSTASAATGATVTSSGSTGPGGEGAAGGASSASVGGGGSSSSSASSGSSTASSGSGGGTCTVAMDCPPAGECNNRVCSGGICQYPPVPDNTPSTVQNPGDCKETVCIGGSPAAVKDDNDTPPPDANPCTLEGCSGGIVTSTNVAPGGFCGVNGACDWLGVCQRCAPVADTCFNGCIDVDESDVDCGIACVPCANNKHCLSGGDCSSGNCGFGICST